MFPDLKAADVINLKVTDSEGNSMETAQRDGAWVLPDAADFPVQADRVSALVDKLATLKLDRPVAESAASHKRLQVAADDFVRRIEFETKDGARRVLYLGSSPQPEAMHYRLDGEDAVHLARGLSALDVSAQPSGYIDASYVAIPSIDVNAITVENEQGRLVFVKDNAGNWSLGGLAPGQVLGYGQSPIACGSPDSYQHGTTVGQRSEA